MDIFMVAHINLWYIKGIDTLAMRANLLAQTKRQLRDIAQAQLASLHR